MKRVKYRSINAEDLIAYNTFILNLDLSANFQDMELVYLAPPIQLFPSITLRLTKPSNNETFDVTGYTTVRVDTNSTPHKIVGVVFDTASVSMTQKVILFYNGMLVYRLLASQYSQNASYDFLVVRAENRPQIVYTYNGVRQTIDVYLTQTQVLILLHPSFTYASNIDTIYVGNISGVTILQ